MALGVGAAVTTGHGVPLAQADETGQTPAEQPTGGQPDETSAGGGGGGGAGDDTGNEPDAPESPRVAVNGVTVGHDDADTGSSPPDADSHTDDVEEEVESKEGVTTEGGGSVDPDPGTVEGSPPSQPVVDQVPPVAPESPVESTPAEPAPPVETDPFVGEQPEHGGGTHDGAVVADSEAGGTTGETRDDPGVDTLTALDNPQAIGPDADGTGSELTAFGGAVEPQAVSSLLVPGPNIIEPEQPDLFAGLAAIPGVFLRLAATVTAAFLSPFLVTPVPIPSPQQPLLWAVLSWVRREFQRTLCNQTPHVVDDASVTTEEDQSVVIDALANDADSDEDPLTVTDFTQPGNGTVAYDPVTGTFTYTPDENFTGVDTFDYAVSDHSGLPHWHGVLRGLFNLGHQASATVTVTVTAVNDAPVAVDDSASTDEDTAVDGDVLANDTDEEGDPLTVSTPGRTIGAYGVLTLNADGTYTYSPGGHLTLDDPTHVTTGTVGYDWTGDAPGSSRGYVATTFAAGATGSYDFGQSGGQTDTVIAVYEGVFDANAPQTNLIAFDDDSGAGLKPHLTVDLVEGQQYTLVVAAYHPGQTPDLNVYATVSGDPANSLADGAQVTDTFTYAITAGGHTDTGTLTITLTGVNDAPVFVAVDTDVDTATGVVHGTVTATDVDGGPLTYTADSGATHGSVTINPQTGEFVYTPTKTLAIIPGSDFESGDFTGWTTGGQLGTQGSVITLESTGSGVATGPLTYEPELVNDPDAPDDLVLSDWILTPAGNHAAALSPNGSQSFAQAGAALGLTAAQQQAITELSIDPQNPGGPQDAAWVSKIVHLEAGTVYTMSWNYISTDYEPYNDGSITTLTYAGGGQETPTVYVNGYENNYAILGFTNPGTGDYSTGSFSSTGWQTSTYQVTHTGDYQIGFAVFNLRDEYFDPVLLLDSEPGATTRDGMPYNPVPPNSPTAPTTVDDTFTVTVDDGHGGSDDITVTVQVTVVGQAEVPNV